MMIFPITFWQITGGAPPPPTGDYYFNDTTLDARNTYLKAGWKLNNDGNDVIGDNDLTATDITYETGGKE